MATVAVSLPPGLDTRRQKPVECEGSTVRDVLDDLVCRRPEVRDRLYREDGGLWCGVFLNGRTVFYGDGLETPVRDGDEIRLLPLISGG